MSRAHRPSRPLIPVAASIVAGALVLLPTAAAAHPFITDGGRVPVRSLATITLDLAHGCGDEQSGAGRDTDEVALEAPAWLRIVDVPEPDGWTVTVEGESHEPTRTIVWSATTGAEPAPRFALDVVVDGEDGQTRHLRVSQRCGDRIERWVGTPDAPAEQPGVRIRLTAADPSSPPPPEPVPTAPPVMDGPVTTPAPAQVEDLDGEEVATGAIDQVATGRGPRTLTLAALAVVATLVALTAALRGRRGSVLRRARVRAHQDGTRHRRTPRR